MNEFKEVRIKVIGEDGETLIKKFPCYDEISVAADCPTLSGYVSNTESVFKGAIDEIIVTITYQWK